jgi:hypothetical protein
MLASWLPTGWGGSGGHVAHCRDITPQLWPRRLLPALVVALIFACYRLAAIENRRYAMLGGMRPSDVQTADPVCLSTMSLEMAPLLRTSGVFLVEDRSRHASN